MKRLLDRTKDYLERLLPGHVQFMGSVSPQLPYYLLDAFEFHLARVIDQEVVFIAPKPGAGTEEDVVRMLAAIHARIKQIPIYVVDGMDALTRRRLIQAGMNFVVPGNQLFAPHLAVDLRERMRGLHDSRATRLSPATQAMLISVLLRGEERFNASSLAEELGYTPMTASRAGKELEHWQLVNVERFGRARVLHLVDSPRDVWQRARQYLASPVMRVIPLSGHEWLDKSLVRLAGETALSFHTMITGPVLPVYAIDQLNWRATRESDQAGKLEVQPELELQIWSYSTRLGKEGRTVDPLSLILSLQDASDPRVEIAVEELESTIWK